MLIQKNQLIKLVSFIGILLFVPLITMQFSSQVNWSLTDFLVAAVLLFALGFSLFAVINRFKTANQKIVFLSIILILFLLIWAELAVGIFGSPIAGS